MSRTAIVALVFAVAAMAAVYLAVETRDMRNPGFILSAYGIVAAVLLLYTWSLSNRLRDARAASPEPHETPDREVGGESPPGL